jgi:hypothetical protein
MIKFNETYTIQNGDKVTFTEGKKGSISGIYDGGTLTGTLEGNLLKATYHNTKVNAAGLMEITFHENGFNAKWKQGLEPGPMKGKWNGLLQGASSKPISAAEMSNLTAEQKEWIEKKDYWDYEEAPKEWLQSKEFILEAVKKDGSLLEYASENLREDRDVVLAAVTNNGNSLRYASENLREDRDVVLAAITDYGNSLEYASENLREDRDVVLAAVTNNGNSLKYASENLRADKEIVLAAVSKDSKMIFQANDTLKQDKEILAVAIQHNPKLSYLINDQLSEDQKQYLEEGVSIEDFDAEYHGDDDEKVEWMKEKAFLMEAVKHDERILKHASIELKADRELVMEAIKNGINAIDYADEDLQCDPEILIFRIVTFFKGKENIIITDEDFNAFLGQGESYDTLDVIENLLFKVEYIVLNFKNEEFQSFHKKIIEFVNEHHECFWILQAIDARLESVENSSSYFPENCDHYENICELRESFDTELDFEPSIEFETYFNDSEINSSWEDCKWTSREDEEGLLFSEFIMDKTGMEWDTDSWNDAKFYNHAISRIWVGLINYSLRYSNEGFDEENGAICLHSVVQEYYEPIFDSGNADYGITTFRVIAEYLLEIPKNDYDLTETDRDDLEEFNGWQFDLNKVANNFLKRDLFECEYPIATEFAKRKQ